MIIEYKALLDKDDLVSLFEWGDLSIGGQRNKANKVMKSIREQYKKDHGINPWFWNLLYVNIINIY